MTKFKLKNMLMEFKKEPTLLRTTLLKFRAQITKMEEKALEL